MKKTKIIIAISIFILLVAGAIVFMTRDTKDSDVKKNLDAIINAYDTGSLSARGETAKQDLIDPLEGKAGTILTTELMEIGYLPPPDEMIMVFILGTSVEKIESDAIAWLLDKGLSKEDLCNLPVVFSIDSPYAEPKEEYKLSTNYLPPYCLDNL